MIFLNFSRHIEFSKTFQERPVNSSTFQACVNPEIGKQEGHEALDWGTICTVLVEGIMWNICVNCAILLYVANNRG